MIPDKKTFGHSCHFTMYLTPNQIREFSRSMVDSLDYHLEIMERLKSKISKSNSEDSDEI